MTAVVLVKASTSGQMLDAGASGYVVKTSAAFDLVPAIECVAAGKRYLSPEIDGPGDIEKTG